MLSVIRTRTILCLVIISKYGMLELTDLEPDLSFAFRPKARQELRGRVRQIAFRGDDSSTRDRLRCPFYLGFNKSITSVGRLRRDLIGTFSMRSCVQPLNSSENLRFACCKAAICVADACMPGRGLSPRGAMRKAVFSRK